jgi:hypothetical protein
VLKDKDLEFANSIRSYYASIDHQLLLDRLAVYIADQQVLNVIAQYLRRCVERGGLFWDHTQGIALGSPLSPILGAFFLTEVDDTLERLGLFSVRYMDDILVLAPTRWEAAPGGEGRQSGARLTAVGEASGQDVYRENRERLRLFGVPLQSRWLACCHEDVGEFRGTCAPAL